MKRICEIFAVVLVALMIGQPMVAFAGSSPRLIPNGTVSVLADGKETNRFQSEMPMPQGMLMACNGNCIIQSQSLQLVARDQAIFALTEAESRWDLTVKTGRVDFAMRAEAKPVSFNTPHDTIRTEQVIVPASSGGLVRGFVSVTDSGTELTVQEGALQVVSRDGTQVVQPGHAIVLAQAKMSPSATGQTGPAGTSGTKFSPVSKGGTTFAGSKTTAMAFAGAGVLGIAGAAAWAATLSGGGGSNVSPN